MSQKNKSDDDNNDNYIDDNNDDDEIEHNLNQTKKKELIANMMIN